MTEIDKVEGVKNYPIECTNSIDEEQELNEFIIVFNKNPKDFDTKHVYYLFNHVTRCKYSIRLCRLI